MVWHMVWHLGNWRLQGNGAEDDQFEMAQTDAEFMLVMDQRNKELFSTPRICTTTVVCMLDKKAIRLDDLRLNPGINIRQKKSKKKQYSPFYNSVTVIFQKTKTIKVFTNGKLHITGSPSLQHAIDMANELITAMAWTDVSIAETRILTMNTTFHLEPKRTIVLRTMFDMLQGYGKGLAVRYTPDIYQGLVLKLPSPSTENKKITILCFYTSSFIITGIRKPDELAYAFECLSNILTQTMPTILA